jgi:hypothetical protein
MGSDRSDLSRWVRLVQAEYRESPGLLLTKAQIQRLWGLDAVTCEALLDVLQNDKFLRRTPQNAYVRADLER